MTLKEILLPQENIMFRTKTKLICTHKKYNIIITNFRILLYSERGRFFKSPDVISERLESIYGIEYNEEGILFKSSKIRIQGGIKFEISGPISEVKPVFNFIQSIVNRPENPLIRRLDD
ncbi:MAG: hypothetical protein E6L04_01930 [Thaumarchaeota archaeon]|nr:MAG: hypothetical protein E6L04_01930 [Nitrososphaerota archaeon]